MTIEVTSNCRLHFGLIAPRPGGIGRRFGGIGLMVDRPSVRFLARTASRNAVAGHWTGDVGPRISAVLERVTPSLGLSGIAIEILEHAPQHSGLGVGTQLALATAFAAASLAGLAPSALELARLAGRQPRSGIGVHGFERGGLLVDGGKVAAEAIAPLVFHTLLPRDWGIVLFEPELPEVFHGTRETQAFARDIAFEEPRIDRLCRLALLGIMPAALEQDFDGFAQSIGEFNWLVGEGFAAAQGGPHVEPRVTRIVERCREFQVFGAGQSSWGPTVFAIHPDADRLTALAERCQREGLVESRQITRVQPARDGARIGSS